VKKKNQFLLKLFLHEVKSGVMVTIVAYSCAEPLCHSFASLTTHE
jgi:hypothetical protein